MWSSPGKLVVSLLVLSLFCLASCTKDKTDDASETAFTWWSPKRGDGKEKSMAELPVFRMLQEETGMTLEFIHPQSGQHAEQFQAMVASGNLPDIISHDFVNDYSGGVEGAIQDGLIIPLNEIIKESAPNLNRYLQEHEEIAAQLRTEKGQYFCFPSLQPGIDIRTYMGPFCRSDLFGELNIQPPLTIDQWAAALSVLKQSALVDIPLSFYGGNIRTTNAFIGAFGIGWGFYREGQSVKYGPLEPGFADFILTLAEWYENGYIDPGFSVNSLRVYQRQAQRKSIGIYIDYVSSIDGYESALRNKYPDCSIAPLRYPSTAEGTRAEFGHLAPAFVPFASAYLTPAVHDPAGAAKLLDYAYSEKGNLLFNFGIPGESYELKGGEPVFKESLAAEKGGFTAGLRRYIFAGPYVKDPRQFYGSLVKEEQKEAILLWSDTHAENHQLPPMYPPAELSRELDDIMNRVRMYEEEAVIRLIVEESGPDAVARFQETLRDMDIERGIEIMQMCWENRRVESQ